MTIQQAKKLKWGTVLKPTKFYHQQFKKRYSRGALFLGVTKDGHNIKVVEMGRKNSESWSPAFWKTTEKVHL